jgi:hypothetical protein
MMFILDKVSGAKVRAGLAVLAAVAAALTGLISSVTAVPGIDAYPGVAKVLIAVSGVVTFLGRFTSLGNVVVDNVAPKG